MAKVAKQILDVQDLRILVELYSMLMFRYILSALLFSGFVRGNGLDHAMVWLSGAAYCGIEKYKSMSVGGPAQGWITADVLYDPKTDLQGYTGYLPSQNVIAVAFRGSSSLLNWIDDAEIVKTDYLTFPDCGCRVHSGFYRAARNLANATVSSVQGLLKKYGKVPVVVTGHSLGAAVCQLISMELRAQGLQNMVYNFGEPRVGDPAYAQFVGSKWPNSLWRYTHNRDPVVHLPPEAIGYQHLCTEVFEDATGKLTTCALCEDPMCADQYSLSKKNGSDHSYYLGHRVDCEESTTQ